MLAKTIERTRAGKPLQVIAVEFALARRFASHDGLFGAEAGVQIEAGEFFREVQLARVDVFFVQKFIRLIGVNRGAAQEFQIVVNGGKTRFGSYFGFES